MKLFLKKSLLFLLGLSFAYLTFFVSSHRYFRKHGDFRLSKDTTRIILGHSHPECAFNDALIPATRNLAQSGESSFFTYQKLRIVLEQNPQIDTVFLEYSNDMIPQNRDSWIWGNEKLNKNLPLYAPFMKWEDYRLILKKNPQHHQLRL